MKTIPFDIKLRKDIQSEENGYKGRYKVQTKSGSPARIICWDKKDAMFPIVVLVEDSSHFFENMRTFRYDGKYYPTDNESSTDLCLVDTFEPKFKVGDKVKYKCTTSIYTITAIGKTGYILSNGDFISFKNENEFELVSEEPELKEIEKELANWVKEYAPRLLELAKKEIIEKLKEE